ncbi:hypothetical protein Cme02nite_54670 [Catellatospora methionotrophica]|uniref:Uncharacterized protein n=1 Tax=Catellatospora methionotrophica TaxID=121620 RepID=A0A8J3LEZ1_9ACTN|nr:hypothetical protein [Catellatospora methionotrophica]GIG17135.1 hypothetical protein Cme02nite_54670 [Catellatospora methionotrophica]
MRAHIKARYVGGWRAELVYRPVILRAVHAAEGEERTCHRWRYDFWPTEPEYGEHLAVIAASIQRSLHGSR